ncbi:MAG: EF-hand domain-containing protein [Chthoniobacterales bacterium]
MKTPSHLLALAALGAMLVMVGCASRPTAANEAALKKRFQQVDTSGDGKISRDEFTDFMIEESFRMYDKDGKGYVTLEEYVAGGGTPQGYKAINRSGSGKVTLAEAKSSELARHQMAQPFDEADADSGGTGYVSYEEFIAFRGKLREAVR